MIKENKFNIIENFCIFLSILFKYLINLSLSKKFLYIYLSILLGIVIIVLFNKKMDRREFFRCFIFLCISMIYVIFYSDVNFLISFILAALCIKKSEKSFIQTFFISSLLLYFITILCSVVGLIPEHNMYRYNDGIYTIRYSLGFSHPNEVFLFFLPIALSAFYLFSDKKIFYFILFICVTILNYFSDCRTGYAVLLLLIFFGIFLKKIERKNIHKIVPILFIIFTLFSVILAIFVGNDINNSISLSLNGRPYYWNFYIDTGRIISLFGNNKVEGFFLDNFYIYLLVQLGMFGYMVYLYIYYKSLSIMKNNLKYMIIVLIFLIYGILEANVIIGSIQFLFAIQIKHIITLEKGE